jgi:hypothetical protein
MVSDDLGRHLHDRATRGETLTASEEAQLTAWYAAQDAAEYVSLALPEDYQSSPELRAQITGLMHRITTVAQAVQTLEKENSALRDEIAALRHQVIQHLAPQNA